MQQLAHRSEAGSRLRLRRPGDWGQALVFFAALLGIPLVLALSFARANELQVIAVELCLLILVLGPAVPFWGLVLFVGLLYVRPEEIIPGLQGMRLSLGVSMVTIAACLVQLCVRRERVASTPLNPMMLGFAAALIASTLPYGNTAEAATEVGKLAALVFLVVNLIRSPQRYRAFVTSILVFTAYVAAYSIYRYYTGGAMDHAGTLRSQTTGIFGDPNDLAAVMVAGIALILVRLRNTSGFARFCYSALGLVVLTATLLTNSRGGFLALLVVGGVFLLTHLKQRLAAVVLAVAIGMVLLVVAPGRMTNFDSAEASANSRFWFWSNGISQLAESPLTGVGFGRFAEVNGGMLAHNSFVQCFAEVGLLGYFFWTGCIYSCFRRRRRSQEALPKKAAAIEGEILGARLALLGFLAAAFWLSRTYVPVLYLFLALPHAAQLSHSEAEGAKEGRYDPRLRPVDFLAIGACAIGSILAINLLANGLR
ncbi:MAG: O-antigen ligase family protein [Armatimonadota bacterium]